MLLPLEIYAESLYYSINVLYDTYCLVSVNNCLEDMLIMNEYEELVSNPIFFERNRVFRVYKGGKLFHDFFGDENLDSNYPEEWIASGIRSLNKNPLSKSEGLSKVQGKSIYFDQLLSDYKKCMLGERENFDILVKVLDSAIRLPAQAHPDKEFSRKYLRSNYGKTEMWVVLATREDAKLYVGFKKGVSKDHFLSAVKLSEFSKSIMESLMNEIRAQTGDIFLIPPKMIHAIGYGCLILEVQEPTDFTLRPEAWCGDYRLNDYEMYLGLNEEQVIECFDFQATEEFHSMCKITSSVLVQTDTIRSESLISYEHTPCFSVNRHQICNGGSYRLENAPSTYIVTSGNGILRSDSLLQTLKKGDYFFLPFAAKKKCSISSEETIELIECNPSRL